MISAVMACDTILASTDGATLSPEGDGSSSAPSVTAKIGMLEDSFAAPAPVPVPV